MQKTVHFFLNKKKLPENTGVYIEATGVDPVKGKLWYGKYADEKEEEKYQEDKEESSTV